MKLEYPDGATPIDLNELDGLIPTYIATQSELNSVENANILKAEMWLLTKKSSDILSVEFLKLLHKKMFEDVWRWAGIFRKTGKNIGIDAHQISTETYKLSQDVKYWIENQTFSWDEIGARFHHRLVWIHPFSNGNGRHARLATDVLLDAYGQAKFSWGAVSLAESGEMRKKYINALRMSDQGSFLELVKFVRE